MIAGETRRSIRVVHITTVHRPYDARIFYKQCVSLAAAGFDVALIQRGDRAEAASGVRIIPLPTYASRFSRMTAGVWRATRLALAERADIVHLHDPELIWGGALLKLAGKRVVYDVHENLHLDIAAKAWLPSWSKRLLGRLTLRLEWLVGLAFDHISAATDGIAERFPTAKTTIVRNAPILADLRKEDALPIDRRPSNMVYIGGLGGGGDVKGVDLMLEAMAALPPDSPIRLLLGGPEPSLGFVDALVRRPGGERVIYLGYVDPKDLGRHYADAIGALVLYPPQPNNVESEPVKLFEAMAAGVPAIISNFPLFERYIERWACGFVLDPSDAGAVAARMVQLDEDRALAARLGRNGQEAVERERNWSIYADRLFRLYDRFGSGGHA